jgi:mannosyl-oligosaccharide alpha-1,2-mannosidase
MSMKSVLYEKPFPVVQADVTRREAVKEAFVHAWSYYERLCFGHDGLDPLSKLCGDSLSGGLTIIDSLSTLILMNLTKEFEGARDYVAKSFRPQGRWSLFEFIIRYLGGLLSAAELSGDQVDRKSVV